MFTTLATVFGYLEDAVKYGPALLAFIQSTVAAVENTTKSGPDKLTAVLNAAETFAEDLLPNEKAEIEAFMAAIEALVNEIVALYNAAGVFVHLIPKPAS